VSELASGLKGFVRAVGEAVETLGPGRLHALAEGVEAGLSGTALCTALPVAGYADAVRAVGACQAEAGIPDPVAAAYLRGVADGYVRSAASERIESVWSGPSSHAVPVRSTAQALVDLISSATAELLLMTYSARPHPPVLGALSAARGRGVRVAIVVETLQGAAGALVGTEPAAAFRTVPGVELWHWPPAARGSPGGKMHAKMAVADRSALLVSSANLTQSGVGTNIEAGVLVRGGHAPRRATEHVAHLIAGGVLVRLQRSGG
jgi:phosphatidylserine/phosphatidylglycerophosphate/cardiolipin synthase-like enzyme